MSFMFAYAFSANPDVVGRDVSKVKTMKGMLQYADLADPEISLWDILLNTNTDNMFIGSSKTHEGEKL